MTFPSIVYLGYPEGSSAIPEWINSLLSLEQNSEDYPYMFYLSGGIPTPRLRERLDASSVPPLTKAMCSRLTYGPTSRMISSIVSLDCSSVFSLVAESPTSMEFRVLADLWMLLRSSLYVVDMDLPSYGRLGLEASCASGFVPILGVSDRSVGDPWFQYHVDFQVKSSSVSSKFPLFISASEDYLVTESPAL